MIRLTSEFLAQCLDLPEDYDVVGLHVSKNDRRTNTFHVAIAGPELPEVPARTPLPYVVLRFWADDPSDMHTYELNEIRSPDHQLIYWPPWPPIDDVYDEEEGADWVPPEDEAEL